MSSEPLRPLILGLSGPALTEDEAELFRALPPAGFILFERNVEDPAQLRALTDSLRDLTGRADLPILIDQEGGRVQRLWPPHWRKHPPGARFGELYNRSPIAGLDAARFHGLAIAAELTAVGINVDCLPLLDAPVPGAHDVIGERAFGPDPLMVAALGSAVLDGLRDGGVCGIVKHIPGHGRAGADSHAELPVVTASRAELAADLLPFQRLADAPMAMTAHVRYDAWDAERCASLSPTVVGDIIRGEVGFDGFLMCDDLAMHALAGPLESRMYQALEAGCDTALHCTGILSENETLLRAAPGMDERAMARLAQAVAYPASDTAQTEDLEGRLDELLSARTGPFVEYLGPERPV